MKKKPAQRTRVLERRDLNEELKATARRLVELFEQRFDMDYVNEIFLEHAFIGAAYSDGSRAALLQYRPDRRLER
jgi:hypothetical protein